MIEINQLQKNFGEKKAVDIEKYSIYQGDPVTLCQKESDNGTGADADVIINKSACTAEKQSTCHTADKSWQHRNYHLKCLYKYKHKRRKQPKTAYIRLKCIDGSKVAVEPGMNDKQTQKQADHNGTAAQPFI